HRSPPRRSSDLVRQAGSQETVKPFTRVFEAASVQIQARPDRPLPALEVAQDVGAVARLQVAAVVVIVRGRHIGIGQRPLTPGRRGCGVGNRRWTFALGGVQAGGPEPSLFQDGRLSRGRRCERYASAILHYVCVTDRVSKELAVLGAERGGRIWRSPREGGGRRGDSCSGGLRIGDRPPQRGRLLAGRGRQERPLVGRTRRSGGRFGSFRLLPPQLLQVAKAELIPPHSPATVVRPGRPCSRCRRW